MHDSAFDGSSPRDCDVLFKQWRIISKVLLFTLHSRERNFLDTLSMGVLFAIEAFVEYPLNYPCSAFVLHCECNVISSVEFSDS